MFTTSGHGSVVKCVGARAQADEMSGYKKKKTQVRRQKKLTQIHTRGEETVNKIRNRKKIKLHRRTAQTHTADSKATACPARCELRAYLPRGRRAR